MTDPPSAPRQHWQPTGGWHRRRFFPAAAIAVIIVVFLVADTTLDDVSPVWFFVLCGAVIALVSIVDTRRVRRTRESRQAAFEALAVAHGWSYLRSDPRFTTRWSAAPFGLGHALRATDVVIGTHRGWPCAAFTYTTQTEEDDSGAATVFGVTTLMLPAVLPRITVSPAPLGGGGAGRLTPDVLVESDTFNRRYRVRSANHRFASGVLQPRTIEALLTVEPFAWRIDGRDLLAWGPATDDAAGVLGRLDVLATIAGNVPEFVWKDIGQPGDQATSYR